MAVEKLKCKECGGKLVKIQSEVNTYVCLYCGSKHVIKPEIHNIVSPKTNTYSNSIDYDEFIQKGITFINLSEYNKAIDVFTKCIDSKPQEYKAWWLRAKAKFLSLHGSFAYGNSQTLYDYSKDFNNAKKLCPPSERSILEEDWNQLVMGGVSESDAEFYSEAVIKKGLAIAAIVPLVIGIILICLSQAFLSTFLIILSIIAFILSLVLFINSKNYVLHILKTRKKTTLKEVMIMYNSKIEDKEKCEIVKQKIEKWIKNGKLKGYKFDGETITKIETQ